MVSLMVTEAGEKDERNELNPAIPLLLCGKLGSFGSQSLLLVQGYMSQKARQHKNIISQNILACLIQKKKKKVITTCIEIPADQ